MKHLIIILFLISSFAFGQTSVFTKYFENTNGTPVTGSTIVLVPDSSTYPADSLTMIEFPTRAGMYYRNAVPDGEYSIYIDGQLYLSKYYIGESRLTEYIEIFKENWDDDNFIINGDGNYIPSTGTQTGISSSLTWSSGTVTPYILDANYTKIREGTPSYDDELTFQHGAATSTEGIYIDVGSENMQMPSTDAVDEQIEDYIHYAAPTNVGDEITISFTDNQVIGDITVEASSSPEITFTNYAAGRVANFIIADNTDAAVVLSISGVSMSYGEQATPTFDDGAWYEVHMRAITSTKCAVSYIRHPGW